jgi:hypothetical protein
MVIREVVRILVRLGILEYPPWRLSCIVSLWPLAADMGGALTPSARQGIDVASLALDLSFNWIYV